MDTKLINFARRYSSILAFRALVRSNLLHSANTIGQVQRR